MECIDPATGGIPADAPVCSETAACPAGYDTACFVTEQGATEGFCLQPCDSGTPPPDDDDATGGTCPTGQECQDVTGQGNMECIDPATGGIPADAPICNETTACPAGYDTACFVTEQGATEGFCLQPC
jgi:hypothetical protein